ncbi:MAG: hypothetical protein CMM46_07180 [Rhodospirillaceae bacterium]|nr:hypothetical protein [Rhodospirillaceae bacterium]|tara:strand:+ start:8388 stop:9011 length:624 start_codon:yes stop_codon:yes gene_type:complete
MAKKTDIPKKALEAALDLAATVGWRDVTMRDIADQAGVSLVELRDAYGSKEALVDAFVAGIDAEVLAGDNADLADESVRDRLFDVMMRRFDALSPHKQAVGSIVMAATCEPGAALAGACRLVGSMRWMLEAAGVDSSGLAGRLRAKGLTAIHVDVMLTWMKDDSEDMAATMAALDKRLDQAEQMMNSLCRFARASRASGPEDAGEAA